MTDCIVNIRDNSNGIAHIVTSHDLLQGLENNEYMRVLKSILRNSLLNELNSDLYQWQDKITMKSLNNFIEILQNKNYDYAFFWFEGTQVTGDIDSEFLEWAKYRNKDWSIMGHILNWENKRPKLHEQVIILNLKNLPCFDKFNNDMANYAVSKDNMHDDYTPVWIKGKQGNNIEKENYNHIFDHVMNNVLSNNGTVVNVPDCVRGCKTCFYADDDELETVEWFLNSDFHNKTLLEKQDFIFETVHEDKQELGVYLTQEDVVFVSNPDEIPSEVYEDPVEDIDVLFTPASGLNSTILGIHYLNTLKKVVWFDISDASLQWIQFTIENWTGKNYKQFYYNNKNMLDSWCLDKNLVWADDKDMDKIDQYFNNISIDDWNQFRNIEHIYIKANIISEYDKITKHANDDNVLLYMTNIYSYSLNFISNKYHTVQSSYLDAMNKFIQLNNNVYFRGMSPNGKKFTTVTNISRTGDI